MHLTLLVHICAGALGIISGYVALSAAKGGKLHRRSGMLFVSVMLTMAALGIVLAAGNPWQEVNIPAAILTAYLVITGLTTVRPPASEFRWLSRGAMLVAFVVGLTCLTFGFEALASGGKRNGVPAFPFLMFGVVGVLASVGDYRMIRSGSIRGTPRIIRHLWRMCFALYIAAASFFWGQADTFPASLRIPALLSVPVLAPILAILYWLWRIRIKKTFRKIPRVRPQEAS